MKLCVGIAVAVLAMLVVAIAPRGAQGQEPPSQFAYADDAVNSLAACLVGVKNASDGIAACLCAAGHDNFTFCGDNGVKRSRGHWVHPKFAAAWAAAVNIVNTGLSVPKPPAWEDDDIAVDVRGSCTLDEASIELAVDPAVTKPSRDLKGILGAKASYAAIYAYPCKVVPETTTSLSADDGDCEELADPVRLCGLGQASATLTAGPLKIHKRNRYDATGMSLPDVGSLHHHKVPMDLALSLTITDVGMSAAAEWALEGDTSATSYGVQYVLVAAVADAVLQVGNVKGIKAIGVAANAKLTHRSLRVDNHPGNIFILDDDTP